MKRITGILIALTLAVVITGCAKKGGQILARVNNTVITLDEFNKKIEMLPKQYQDIVKNQKKNFLDDIVKEELLYQEALKSNIDKDPETQKVVEEAKKKIIVFRLINDRVNEKVSVSDEEIKKYYDEHSEDFLMPERWRASHILVSARQEAEDIKNKLAGGASFEDIAKEKSKDATAKQGGDVGYFSKGQLIPEFETACLALEIGQISDIVETKFGYHIIKLMDKKSPEVQKFEDVKDLIKKEREREQQKGLFENMMNDLMKSGKVTINSGLLGETKKETDAKEPITAE